MRNGRLGLFALAVAVAALALSQLAVAAPPSATSAKRHSCGTITSASIYRKARVYAIRGVTCKRARQVARAYDAKGRQLGSWQCGLAHDDGARLFSCGAGRGTGDLRKRAHALEAVGTGGRG
jgi:hypothetical protein